MPGSRLRAKIKIGKYYGRVDFFHPMKAKTDSFFIEPLLWTDKPEAARKAVYCDG